jgi:hypothetical protein
MIPDQDTKYVLKALIRQHEDMNPIVSLARRIVQDMEREEETLNRWADELQEQQDLIDAAPF